MTGRDSSDAVTCYAELNGWLRPEADVLGKRHQPTGSHYVKHYLYCSSGNTEGLDEYIAFFEIADDGYCSRYLELGPMGNVLRYTEDDPADEYGALPERPWDAREAAKPKYGTLNDISKELFDSAWNRIHAS